MSDNKRHVLYVIGFLLLPFAFYGWMAAIAKFLNEMDRWLKP